MTKEWKAYQLTPISSTEQGGIRNTSDGYGFYFSNDEDLGSLHRDNVISDGEDVYIDSKLLSVFFNGQTFYFVPAVKIGRRNFFRVSPLFDEILGQAIYPRRSEKETSVANRNLAMLEKLLSISESL